MNVTADCIPCYLNQSLNALEKGEWPVEEQDRMLLQLLPVIAELPVKATPAENSTVVLHRLVELMGGNDPFLKAKKQSNQAALAFVDRLRQDITGAEDPVRAAVKFAVAGNVVDMGLFDDYDLAGAIREVTKNEFKTDDYSRFSQELRKVRRVLIIGDNSGEIVFDRLLVEVLQARGVEVTYGVKGSFILNDATREDAVEAGIDKICRVVDNGCNYLGTVETRCGRDFLAEFGNADLVISKGQANYESLEGTELAGEKTFFLLKAKCPVVARHIGVQLGDIVFVRNKS